MIMNADGADIACVTIISGAISQPLLYQLAQTQCRRCKKSPILHLIKFVREFVIFL